MAGIENLLIAELLCSHLCHELISPVTAVNNGMELIGADDPRHFDEALGLVRQSATEAARRLQFFRLAYGQAAGFDAARGGAQARDLALGLFQGGKVELRWPPGANISGTAMDKNAAKLLLNMVALAREMLPRGGVVTVEFVPAGQESAVEVVASGPGARVSEDAAAAMAPDVEPARLTPRTVQAYLVAWLARKLDAGLRVVAAGPDRIRLSVALKPAA